ncbi:DoxX family protein [Actinomadura formosensis]|uniref:DoxX family protein n=1 Tax=Actinomadura formosensis TaxID=60706 RepID=UPI000A067527|nr:DoxX family protein [Actinomadura formosensis]
MRSRPLYDGVAVLTRLGVGVIFMAHGWQKIEAGITATGRSFGALGVPFPTAAAVYSTFIELLGGAALIAGLALPVTGILLFVDMAGAFVFVHADQGLFLVDGGRVRDGYELALVLGMAGLLFAAGGGGSLTLDQWVIGKRLRRPDDDEDEEDAASFVESLRQAEPKPAQKSRRPAKTPAAAPEPAKPPKEPAKDSGDDLVGAGRHRSSRRRRAAATQPVKQPSADDEPRTP